jgi:lysozyme family protein
MQGENIFANSIAQTIFDYGVNTGMGTSVKNVQRTLKIVDDGDFGPKTLAALNSYIMTQPLYKWSEEFTLRKLLRYAKIVTNESKNIKFMFGWTSRSFENLETMYDLDLVTEHTFNELYSYIKAGRNDKALRLDTHKCMDLVTKCLKQYGIM